MADILEHPTFGQPPVANVKAPGPKRGTVNLQRERGRRSSTKAWGDFLLQQRLDQEAIETARAALDVERAALVMARAEIAAGGADVREQLLGVLEAMGYTFEHLANSGPDYETAATLRLLQLARAEMERLLGR